MTNGAPRLEGSVVARDYGQYPMDDESLGLALFAMVTRALDRGRPAPAFFVLGPSTVDRFSIRTLSRFAPAMRGRLLGAIPGAECMAALGAFRFKGRGAINGQWVASTYIEWPDNRWWSAWQPLGPGGRLVGASPQILSAADGAPRPGGVGGWFAMARRNKLSLTVRRDPLPVH